MADGFFLSTNLPDFKAQLREFGFDMERKVFRSGVAAAANVFKAKAVQLAPTLRVPRKDRTAGLLKKAIYIKRSKDSRNGLEHYFVGVRQGRAARQRKGGSLDAFYWRWVEQGHIARGPGQALRGGRRSKAIQRSRYSGSRVPAYPFLAPAFQRAQQQALQAFNDRVQKRIDKENSKR